MVKPGTDKAKTDKGTHYSPREDEQRSYFLPRGLGDTFKKFCHGRASVAMPAAMIMYMASEANLREKVIRAVNTLTVREAITVVRTEMEKAFTDARIQKYVDSLPEDEKVKVLARLRKS
jgi:hypothetical protein